MNKMLKRWMALDLALGQEEGVIIKQFAKQWKVSVKTVRRDLAMFRELADDLGREIEVVRVHGGVYQWMYRWDTYGRDNNHLYVFTSNYLNPSGEPRRLRR